MKYKKSQIEFTNGVSQRQPRRAIGDFNDTRPLSGDSFGVAKSHASESPVQAALVREEVEIITEQDIIENTRSDIDKSRLKVGGWWSRRRAKRLAKKRKLALKPKWYRIGYRTLRFAGFAILLVGGYLAISSWSALNSIIDRGGDGALALQDNILPSQLKGEGDGRINILLLGIGGEEHVAGDLADSIIVASIDPFANELAMLSVPRDLYVDIPGYYSTRINAAHSIGEEQGHPGGGIALMEETLENVLGIDIHYYARVDFQGFVEAIDTVGGVTITLEEPVYDPNFDWQFGSNALDLPAGDVTLDGQTALLLARARGASGVGIGVSRGDFGRGEKQREILVALKKKIFSVGTFANPARISSLLQSAGNHARTDLQVSEMMRLYEILGKIPDDKIISFGLDNGADNYLDSDNIGGAAVLVPRSGDFSEIQLFVRQLFIDGFIRTEQPLVDVYNGTIVAGLAADTADELKSYGYKVGKIENAASQDVRTSIAYDLSDGKKPYTKALLSNRFNVTMKPASELPEELSATEADFVIIMGDDYVQENPGY